MGSEPRVDPGPDQTTPYLRKFKLYETPSNFYMIGKDEKKTIYRVLKIDRTEPAELNIFEDPTEYSRDECRDLRRRIHEGNKKIGGLKCVATCYGIIGFVRFLEPYYMLVITKTKKLGAIFGHTVYGIAKSEMIQIPHPSVRSKVACSEDENRYKKLLCMVDLTKGFFFSYSYHIMYSLQKNLCDSERGKSHYETMFVWNAFLTRGSRNTLNNTIWTVALVYGCFEQAKLSTSSRVFQLILIARRSRHYAGTRYLRRGVNDKGRVANDVETEQIVFEDVPEGYTIPISSVVQNRGSIPLFWSQETSLFNPQPDIKLYKKERNYEATQLHFKNLVERYGNPIIILNLIKTNEKKRRETILRAEYAKAILFINRSLRKERPLRAIHFDLNKHFKNGAIDAFDKLRKFATIALKMSSIFYCEVSTNLRSQGLPNQSCFDADCFSHNFPSKDEDATSTATGISIVDTHKLQTGMLRTNCIDGLDRTNFAQYAFGLEALGCQLNSLHITESSVISHDNPLAMVLMGLYQTMGDTLALQYGGSAAHQKMFSELRGQWNAAMKSHEILKSLHRHYSNAYLDGEKQNAINVFLGHFQPQQGNPALWELDSDQHYNIGRYSANFDSENPRSSIKRSLSENIIWESDSTMGAAVVGNVQRSYEIFNNSLSDFNPEFSIAEAETSYSRYSSAICCRQHFRDMVSNHVCESGCFYNDEHGDQCIFTSLIIDRLYSSINSCEECSSVSWKSSDNIYTDMENESITSTSGTGSSLEFLQGRVRNRGEYGGGDILVPGYSNEFVRWVLQGEAV